MFTFVSIYIYICIYVYSLDVEVPSVPEVVHPLTRLEVRLAGELLFVSCCLLSFVCCSYCCGLVCLGCCLLS